MDKVKELKHVLTPDHYYYLSYKTGDGYVYNSKYIFKDKYRLIDHLLNIIEKNNFHSCEKCFNEFKTWTKEQAEDHILAFNHYTIDNLTYNIVSLEIVK
jgi:hypothetical protein